MPLTRSGWLFHTCSGRVVTTGRYSRLMCVGSLSAFFILQVPKRGRRFEVSARARAAEAARGEGAGAAGTAVPGARPRAGVVEAGGWWGRGGGDS